MDLRSDRPRAAMLLGLLVAAFAIRLWDFGNPVVHVDEQYYLLVGDRMLHGAVPYVDLWDRKPVGLFLIYAAIRSIPGEGILAYQVAATLFAAATAMLVLKGARMLGATRGGAMGAGLVYLVWLPLLSGRGGQSPVFYDLFVTGAALLTLRLPTLASVRAIVWNGAAACLLAGLAIQTKYTPFVEGAFFGLVHLWYLARAGGRWTIVPAALLWIVLGILPTALVVLDYAMRSPAVFDAFWFSNFGSVQLRRGYPAAKIVGRLSGTWAQLAPLVVCALLASRRPRTPARRIALGWIAAALVAYVMIGAFFDHYALPLVAPLAMLAAATFRDRRILAVVLAAGLATLVGKAALRPNDAAGARMLGRVVEANDAGGCPYVFAGDSVTYVLAHACTPTAYAFPSTLAYAPEIGASGVDETAEVARIMAKRPPVVVTLAEPLAPWNPATHAIVAAALARDYRPVFETPREGTTAIAWLRRDRAYRRPL